MRYLSLAEVLRLHELLLASSGGPAGIRDLGRVEAALAQPKVTFAGQDLYPTVLEKAAALAFSLIQGHPFVDGNKRTGHAAMSVFLMLNGYELSGDVDAHEHLILGVAAGSVSREELLTWLKSYAKPQRE